MLGVQGMHNKSQQIVYSSVLSEKSLVLPPSQAAPPYE